MKTVIWDYNGTILDDAGISVEIENTMLERRGLASGYSVEQYRDMFTTTPMIDYYRTIGYTFEDETFDDVAIEFNELYDELFETCQMCEGVEELLEYSRNQGYRNIILSSCENTKLHEQCERLGIASYFDAIMGVDNLLGGSKIHLGLDWMEQHQVLPEDCIYLGDTFADLETSKAMGIEQIYLIANGHQSYNRLKKEHENTYHTLKEVRL